MSCATTKILTPGRLRRYPIRKALTWRGLWGLTLAPASAVLLALCLGLPCGFGAQANALAQAQRRVEEKQASYQKNPHDVRLAWELGRACFDLADLATNRAQRATAAQQGIDACREALVGGSNSAPAHYYLALNLGELARTKTLGALRLVSQMEHELIAAAALDPQFDFGGAERSLGLLYRDAPSFSVGDRAKARVQLQKALELAPNYPENHLNLIESELKWNERTQAREHLKILEQNLPKAHDQFAGPAWAASWADWDARLAVVRSKLGEPAHLDAPRH